MRNIVYLCGKCTGLSFEEMSGWRLRLKERIEDICYGKFIAFNPCEYFGAEWYAKPLTFEEKQKIKDFDLNAVRMAKLLVVNMEAIETSIGSLWEIAVAKELGIPILAFNLNESNTLHDWLETSITWRCKDEDEILSVIETYYNYL